MKSVFFRILAGTMAFMITASVLSGCAKKTEEPTPTDPTAAPTEATTAPTEAPTAAPTDAPTQAPTAAPTQAPTEKPTQAPTEKPTQAPTEKPTQVPTVKPTAAPTEKPTQAPTVKPTAAPTEKPTQAPTQAPTPAPTQAPTPAPTQAPTPAPTAAPTEPPAPDNDVGKQIAKDEYAIKVLDVQQAGNQYTVTFELTYVGEGTHALAARERIFVVNSERRSLAVDNIYDTAGNSLMGTSIQSGQTLTIKAVFVLTEGFAPTAFRYIYDIMGFRRLQAEL
ncbi:MAG: hypothetical protein IJO56_02880 [Oscillospiraceae bacterium]|nr:hypothetical protein [Oscillospiraceae bacterium]